MTKKIGVVGTPGGWSSEKLADTVADITGHRLLIDMERLALDLPGGSAWFEDTDLSTLDALIVKKIGAWYSPDLLDRLEMLRFLNERGLPVFSPPLNIMRVLDRLSCTVTLQLSGIPMPPTTITEEVDAATNAVARYGDAVFKPLYSTKAKGMLLLSDGPDTRRAIEAYHNEHPMMYIQKKQDLQGKDLGIAFLGGQYLATYARVKGEGAWDTTTRSGGHYEAFTPPEELIALAYRAQAPFKLDFTCVDVAETPEGPIVFEVSAFGGFRGIETASGIDAAHRYVHYVLERIRS
ncbi:MAG: GAK system ATP-grasp enzyme [Desulfobacterales bacterium]|jgi:ribosomal protein S6--L-glutamate ligase